MLPFLRVVLRRWWENLDHGRCTEDSSDEEEDQPLVKQPNEIQLFKLRTCILTLLII